MSFPVLLGTKATSGVTKRIRGRLLGIGYWVLSIGYLVLGVGPFRVLSDTMLKENEGVRYRVSGVGCQEKELLDTET